MWLDLSVAFAVLLIIAFVWRFVARLWIASQERGGPPDEAEVFARTKPRPRSGAGAVALEEPDDDNDQH